MKNMIGYIVLFNDDLVCFENEMVVILMREILF